MTSAEHACRDSLLYGRGEVEQPQGVADVRPGAADPLRELLVGGAEVVEQLLVGGGLLERVELLAVQVLDQGIAQQLVVLGLLDDGADPVRPARWEARQRRSPMMSSYRPGPAARTTTGWSRPTCLMDSASSSSASSSKVRLGCRGFGVIEETSISL